MLNMRVKVRGALGTIAGFEGPRLLVLMDGQKSLTTVHPVLGVEYPTPGKVFAPAARTRGRSHLSLVPERSGPGRPPKVKSDQDLWMEPLPVDDPRHGTLDGYRKFKCKCAPCRGAWRERCQELKAARITQALDPNDPRHGTRNFYSNYDCRCRPCTDAMVQGDPRCKGGGPKVRRPKAKRPRPANARAELQASHSEVTGIARQDVAS